MAASCVRDASRWRSLLFVPAHQERFVAGSHRRGADALILDLEDSVPAGEKATARDGLAASLAVAGQAGAAVLVRVNHGLCTLSRDLEAAVTPGVAALVLPKVESADWIGEVADAVLELEVSRGLPAGAIQFVLQIETPAALPRLPGIASAHARVAAMTVGPEDFCAAIGATPDRDCLLGPNLAVLYAARAAGIIPLGFVGSIGAYDDIGAFAQTVAQARRLGFRGAMAVHPSQVAILNDGFAPSPAEVEWAGRVIAGDAEARQAGRGAFRLDGHMIDPPIVRRAREIVERAGETTA